MNVVFRTLVLIAFLHFPFANRVAAADNVLMLPAAKSPKNPPSIVLHGGGVITEDEAKEHAGHDRCCCRDDSTRAGHSASD